MILDICACIPFSIIFNDTNDTSSQKSGNKGEIKLIRLLRLYRLFKIFRLIKAMAGSKEVEDNSKIRDSFRLSATTSQLIGFLIKSIIAIHVVSCI